MSKVIEGNEPETGLVIIQPTAAIEKYEEPEDNANWGEDEAPTPQFIQLKQPTTENCDHIPNGHFFHKASGQVWAEVKLVVLQMHKGRAWKPSSPAFVKGEKVACRAINRTSVLNSGTPITNNSFLTPQAKDCSSCPRNQWEENGVKYDKITKKGPKPTCQKDFFFLFLDSETNLPYIYSTEGKGVDPSDAVYDAVRARAKVVKAKTGKMPSTFDFEISMVSEKDGKYYKPKFTTVRQLKSEDSAKFGPYYEMFVLSRQNAAASVIPEDATDIVDSEDTGAVDEVTEI
jgi:hypothetical protein